MKTIRSFLALNIDLHSVRLIDREQRILRNKCEEAGITVKWVSPQNLHLTMRFLGEITDPMIRAVKDIVEKVTRSFPPFEMETAGLGVFPDTRNPQVIWVGVHSGGSHLERLHTALSRVLEETGFKSDGKPFKSHVTIGRIKGGDTAALAGCLEEGDKEGFGRSKIRDLICYSSVLNASGADYHLLWSLPLLGRAPRPTSETQPAGPGGETKE
jgi:2'-5' RNA ligase